MQNRYLFRGKRIDNQEWVMGAYFIHHAIQLSPISDTYKEGDILHLICISGFADWNMPRPMQAIAVDPATVGQCTGLKDKNGKLIYEGDIVKHKTSPSSAVIFAGGAFRLGFENGHTLLNRIESCEIIGNIHENH